MNPFIRAIVLTMLLLVAVARAPAAPPAETMPPEKSVLPNGMTVILQEDHSSRVVSLSAFVKIGARHESGATAGVRYFLQQMLRRGASRQTAQEIEGKLADIGAGMDVTVGDDYVELYATGGGPNTAFLVSLMGEVLLEPRFDPAEIEKARKDILSQLDGHNDHIRSWAYQSLRESLYQDVADQPFAYALPPIGRESSIQRIQKEHLLNYHRLYYVPNNTVLVAVGDFDTPQTLQQVRETFEGSQPRDLPKSFSTEFMEPSDYHLDVKERDVDAAWLLAGYRLPPASSSDAVPLRVVSALLGEGMGSLLYKDLRNREAIAYEAASTFTPRVYACELLIYLQTNPMEIDHAKERVFANIESLQTQSVSQADLRRAIEYASGTFALAHMRTRERAWHYALFESLGLGYEFDLHFAQKMRQVTAADVQRVCKQYLNCASFVLVMPSAL